MYSGEFLIITGNLKTTKVFKEEKSDNVMCITDVVGISIVAVPEEYSLMIKLFISSDTVRLNPMIVNLPYNITIINVKTKQEIWQNLKLN